MPDKELFDVLVVGAGPAGIAAALAASIAGGRVGLVDDNAQPGGQIYRATQGKPHGAIQTQLAELSKQQVVRLDNSTVYDAPADGTLAISGPGGTKLIGYKKLILAVGARELFLPFPGWTMPGVMGVGGLQALVKSGLDVYGKRIVVAGSGPLLLAVGAYLAEHGARLIVIAEQAPLSKLARFSASLIRYPSKLSQGASLMKQVGARIRCGSWIESAGGADHLEWVALRTGSKVGQIECDYLACAFGFVPNLELPMLIGCDIENGFVKVSDIQQTSVSGVFCVGEPTGIGGVDLSIVEGKIAGFAASGQGERAKELSGERNSWQRFADSMNQAFALRQDLRELPTSETVVCRCEDVRLGQLAGWGSSRAAKLHTRCGMGPCQGRICGPATQFLMNWEHGSVRPPLSPVPLAGLENRSNAETTTN